MADVPVDLFAAVPQAELRSAGQLRTFATGEVVMHRGDEGAMLHRVERGRFASQVVTPMGDVATLAVHGPGEVVGLLAALRPGLHRTATVVALEPARTLAIGAESFARLRASHTEVARAAEQVLIDLLIATNDRLVEALYEPAPGRVRARLRALGDIYRAEPGISTVTIPLSQEHLAGLAGTTRETVNRVLREEVDRGCLVLSRRRITVDLNLLRPG